MLTTIKSVIKFGISVYEGISPELLATMSLGQGIKGRNHQELIESLRKNNIVQSERIIWALKELDRQKFTSDKDPYENKPYSISGKEKMTDILTHAVVLQALEPWL